MSFKDNLKAKIQLDRLYQRLTATIRETPGQRRLDKDLMQKLLDMSDLEHRKVRDLHLYLRPLEGETMDVLVFDNELPIYHTTVDDVALRKSPEWKEMFSIRNIKRVLNDQDVIVSKGKESLKRIHAHALELLDLDYNRGDMEGLVEDARRGLEQRSLEQIQETIDLFIELLSFQPVSLGSLEHNLQVFGSPTMNNGTSTAFEHPIFFDEDSLLIGLKKGSFSPQSDLDLAWVIEYVEGKEKADLVSLGVFEFLANLAMRKAEVS